MIESNAEGEINKCVHCGFCLESCPTYVITRSEVHSPRGRIMEVKLNLKSDGIDTCMYCRRCEIACPSGVIYSRIITSARKPDVFKKIMLKTLEKPKLLYVATKGIMKGNEEFSLRIREFIKQVKPPLEINEKDANLYVIPGCIMSTYFRDTVENVVSFLQRREFRIKIINGCCGLAHYSEGDVKGGDNSLNELVKDLRGKEAICLSSNCTAHMREKGFKVMDLSEFLIKTGTKVNVGEPFVVHYPCHAHLEGLSIYLEDAIKDKENEMEMEDPSFECGAGGAFFLFNKEISDSVIEEKNRKVRASKAKVVISTNPSCSLALRKSGLRVVHLGDLLH